MKICYGQKYILILDWPYLTTWSGLKIIKHLRKNKNGCASNTKLNIIHSVSANCD